jgi:hypothetical protein
VLLNLIAHFTDNNSHYNQNRLFLPEVPLPGLFDEIFVWVGMHQKRLMGNIPGVGTAFRRP